MATIFKTTAVPTVEPAIYRFDDVVTDLGQIIADAKAEAAAIMAEARDQADEVRCRAEVAGRAAAAEAAQQAMHTQLQSLLPAMAAATQQIAEARQAWLQSWQKNAVALSVKIAERIIRREIEQSPTITLAYVREALEMCASLPQVRVLLHPLDAQSLGDSVDEVVREIAPMARAEIVGDVTVSRGGCRIETRHGEIDLQIETQLRRIEAELALRD
ncbi:MAG: hypothetical protein IT427_06350 [Pirellulales bacterium]|nr:hypothetical protein [Pirellulales bacterium]